MCFIRTLPVRPELKCLSQVPFFSFSQGVGTQQPSVEGLSGVAFDQIQGQLEEVQRSLSRMQEVLSKPQQQPQPQAAGGDPAACNYGTVDLFPLHNSRPLGEKVFLLETSGRATLGPRQACAVESAARAANVSVVVMVYSPFLDLADNTTCQVHRRHSGRVHFHRIVPELDFKGDARLTVTPNKQKATTTLFKDTPLYDVWKNGTFTNSQHLPTHLSDALRLAYVFKVSPVIPSSSGPSGANSRSSTAAGTPTWTTSSSGPSPA